MAAVIILGVLSFCYSGPERNTKYMEYFKFNSSLEYRYLNPNETHHQAQKLLGPISGFLTFFVMDLRLNHDVD